MKKIMLYIIVAISLLSCKKDEPMLDTSVLFNDITITPSYTEANVSCFIFSKATISEVLLECSHDSTFVEYEQIRMINKSRETDQYKTLLTRLKENTTYYTRFRVINKYSSCISNSQSFSTKEFQLPSVRLDSISSITVSSAELHAKLLDWGSDTLPQVGFCIANHQNVTINDSLVKCVLYEIEDSIPFSSLIDGLKDNATYYLRAYAKNGIGIAYSEEMCFSTMEILLPTLASTNISNVTYTSAKCQSSIISNGGSSIANCGFCYATTHNPTIANKMIVCSLNSFTADLTNLSAGTTYYIRSFATNSKGTAYGVEESFTTLAYGLPTITDVSITDITANSARCAAMATDDGGTSITQRGICYSIFRNPTTANNKISSGSGSGFFACNLSHLTMGTTYYVRAYATNNVGTVYSTEKSFTTLMPPTITLESFSISTANSVNCMGKINSDGSTQITDCGFCWSSTSVRPTLSDNSISGTLSSNTFTALLTNLQSNTTYYVQAYATNSVGTSYSTNVLEILIPVITYNSSSKLAETTQTFTAGLHTNAFGNATIISHAFTRGVGKIVFSEKVVNIDSYAFYKCSEMTTITLPNTISSMGSHAFYSCSALTSFDIPSQVSVIEDHVFCLCKGLTSISIPYGVTNIGDNAFGVCTNLTYVSMPNGITYIGEDAFSATNINHIYIPQSTETIGNGAFSSCTNLAAITCYATNPPTCGQYAFSNVYKGIPVYVPSGSVSAYQQATGWSEFTNFIGF